MRWCMVHHEFILFCLLNDFICHMYSSLFIMKYKDPKIVAGQTSQIVSSRISKVALVTLALGLTLRMCERTLKLRLKNPIIYLTPNQPHSRKSYHATVYRWSKGLRFARSTENVLNAMPEGLKLLYPGGSSSFLRPN